MQEQYNNEQYFFVDDTIAMLSDRLARFESVCALCAPMLGRALEACGTNVTTLDVDGRFRDLKGLRHWDLRRPAPILSRFDVIFCDPPFFSVSLREMLRAIALLSHYDFTQRLAVTYLTRRRSALLDTFAPFRLKETGLRPQYVSVANEGRNEIEVFANFAELESRGARGGRVATQVADAIWE